MLKFASIILGVSGIIAFFPVNFGNRHTCLAHKYLGTESYSCCEIKQGNENFAHRNDINPTDADNHHLTNLYLYPFGFLWWASIGLVVLQLRSIGLKRKRLDKRNKDQLE